MKKYIGLIALMGILSIPMAFNSCQATHLDNGVTSFSSNGPCVQQIHSGSLPVYNYVRSNLQCATCHYRGSTAAPAEYYFADSSLTNAMDGFANLAKGGSSKFYDKVYTSHFGGAGPQNQAALEPLKAAFIAAGDAFNTCVAQQNNSGTGGGGGSDLNPTKQTIAKTIPANPTAAVSLLWNLGNEMQTAGSALPGAQFRITIQAVTSATGVQQYYITAPQAQGATAGAIQIRNIRILLNGVLVALGSGGGTWTSLNNLAPAGRLHPLAQGTGVMILRANTSAATNTIAIGFGTLEVSTMYPDFNPTTYARLTSADANIPAGERVFSQRCQSCHGASGGLSLAAANLSLLKQNMQVVPFNPAGSRIFQRLSGQGAIMPPAGALPAAEIRLIRDWILDGAP